MAVTDRVRWRLETMGYPVMVTQYEKKASTCYYNVEQRNSTQAAQRHDNQSQFVSNMALLAHV